MYTLYGIDGSGSATIEIALALAQAPWRRIDTASWAPNDAYAELLAVNPLGQVPTLVLPDGSVLSESVAILIHLADAHPAARLLPPAGIAAAQRAQLIRGLVFIAANCYAAIGVIDFPARWCVGAEADAALQKRIQAGSRAWLHHCWETFADLFPARPWLGGESPGALDLLAAVVSRWAGARAHLRTARPEFHAVLARIDAHPAVAPVFARHWPAT